jgi:hypothetical protein
MRVCHEKDVRTDNACCTLRQNSATAFGDAEVNMGTGGIVTTASCDLLSAPAVASAGRLIDCRP